ncbi:NAD(P)-binding protein [Sodiomyces alkalinus F11]|uniref:NAD(P)-binding protein n=1 Tax=Sodiomyces alkalinus (strain CBS 110278 / VKM F-3762 / F11) TaxID=1314773 RepID=A0A3N2Q5J8_SODAK|nr:NAD(P)-binding protein [Sodiomyces alkalinus F11]ROT42049.1 NAD(P)-binding protein [Sodiomyces alkalinus F11]
MTGIALLGAGIFAREEHLPAIQAIPSLTLKAIYSRSEKSASLLALSASSAVDIYYDVPAASASASAGGQGEDRSLDALLKRDDIAAVVVCLPILTQPAVIRKALEAGKHVLSEKPVAKDVATARELMDWYNTMTSTTLTKPVWAVAENFRFWPAIVHAVDKIREVGGKLVTFNLDMFTLVKDDSQYYNTAWRKTPEYQGGFLLDGGVHFIAALRSMLAAAEGEEVTQLTARSALLQPRLPPVDTVYGVLTTRGGVSGTASISFGIEFKAGLQCQVVTTEGSVTMTSSEVTVVRRGGGDGGAQVVEKTQFGRDSGVKAETEAFAASIARGGVDARQTPLEALKDLQILEGLLESGAAGGAVKAIQ